jgi:hypothetical protein
MANPGTGLQWWDREFDYLGNPIRSDVRQAAHEIWSACCGRTCASLGDVTEAPELMEAAIVCISRHLDRSATSQPAADAKRLLGMRFSQMLHRRAAKLGRIKFVGTTKDLDDYAPSMDWNWSDRVNLWLDFDKLRPLLNERNFAIFLMRRAGHPWHEVSEKTGIPSDKARAAFWRAIDKARSIMAGKKHLKGKERK